MSTTRHSLGASSEIKWLNRWSAAATFEGEFSAITVGKREVRYQW
jgi:hypothetical protein